MKCITKMRRIMHSTKRIQIEVSKSNLGILNLANDVIHDAQKEICDINFKKFGDILHFG